jgi:hypothetical protein
MPTISNNLLQLKDEKSDQLFFSVVHQIFFEYILPF